jgi:hypothetical protein
VIVEDRRANLLLHHFFKVEVPTGGIGNAFTVTAAIPVIGWASEMLMEAKV